MRDLAFTAALGLCAAAMWVLFGILKAIRNSLSERAAGWLLPPGQPVTFRLAQLVAIFTREIAPGNTARFALPVPNVPGPAHLYVFPVFWDSSTWSAPAAAAAELDADLRVDRPVLRPLRLVAPLPLHALAMRLRNIFCVVAGIFCIPVCLAVLVVLGPPVVLSEWQRRGRR